MNKTMDEFKARAVNRERGVGMIEILIAIILISIGFLAVARMQVQSMRFSQSAYNRSQSYLLANDIIDRMRANVEGVYNGYYDGQVTTNTYTSPDCSATTCTPEQVATQDLAQWSAHLYPVDGATPALPSAESISASGTIVANGDNGYTINIVWAEEAETQNLSVSFVAQGKDSS